MYRSGSQAVVAGHERVGVSPPGPVTSTLKNLAGALGQLRGQDV
jgi:hypothetical protein